MSLFVGRGRGAEKCLIRDLGLLIECHKVLIVKTLQVRWLVLSMLGEIHGRDVLTMRGWRDPRGLMIGVLGVLRASSQDSSRDSGGSGYKGLIIIRGGREVRGQS
jgi:hypothetical protein